MLESDSKNAEYFIKLVKFFGNFNPKNVEKKNNLRNIFRDSRVDSWVEDCGTISKKCQFITKEMKSVQYDEYAKDLHQKMKNFYYILAKNNPSEFKDKLETETSNFTKALSLVYHEICRPTIATVNIGKIELRLKTLGKIQLSLFWAAVDGLQLVTASKDQKAFFRRVAVIALCGGVPIDLLNTENDFKFKSDQFQSIGIPIGDNALVDESVVELIDSLFNDLESERCKFINFSEASLKMIFWDPLFTSCFIDSTQDSKLWAIRSEVNLKDILNLNCERRADIAVFDTKFQKIIVFCEAALESFHSNVSHKDFSKINSLLTISCIDLSKSLAQEGFDPLFARTFGVLVGGPCFQFAVAHPVFTETDDKKGFDIRVDVSTNPHWYGDIGGNETNSIQCSEQCCLNKTLDPIIKPSSTKIPTHEASKDAIEYLEKTDLEKEEEELEVESKSITECKVKTAPNAMEVDPDPMEAEVTDFVAMVENVSGGINKAASRKLSIFIKVVKDYIKKLSQLKPDPSKKKYSNFNKPNLVYVPVASGGATKETPANKQLYRVTSRTDQCIITSSSNRHRGKPKKVHESELYMKKLNAFFCFPRVLDSWKFRADYVDIDFEEMIPLIGDGFFGPHGDLFGPQISTESALHLILDACTFAVHILYGLYVLHEVVGYVHGDISPENILFSPDDDIWKLNDFESALPVSESLEKIRKCGTEGFIAPESLKTGIFTKASDIYALGQVLWKTFHTQIMWICSFEEEEEVEEGGENQTQKAYEEFFEAVKLMIKDLPSSRPSVISSMKSFNRIIKDNPIRDFHIYGSEKLMTVANKLIEEFPDEMEMGKEIVDIPFNEITTNIM